MRRRAGLAPIRHEAVADDAATPGIEYATVSFRPTKHAEGQAGPEACQRPPRALPNPPARIRFAESDDDAALRKLSVLLGGLMDPRSRLQ